MYVHFLPKTFRWEKRRVLELQGNAIAMQRKLPYSRGRVPLFSRSMAMIPWRTTSMYELLEPDVSGNFLRNAHCEMLFSARTNRHDYRFFGKPGNCAAECLSITWKTLQALRAATAEVQLRWLRLSRRTGSTRENTADWDTRLRAFRFTTRFLVR